ncbi:MAG: 50S ribosomal protein L11 methyltransferase [Bacteroidota bacterium]
MAYKQYSFSFENPDEEILDVLTAYLSHGGFEGFYSEGNVLNAYIEEENLEAGQPEAILSAPAFSDLSISFEVKDLPIKNWNEEWERSYEPVIVDDICAIIAPFHYPPEGIKHIIHIEPKMSFGTGHHETTRLMIKQINKLQIQKKRVLDMGCGTGVLGIFALMKNASFVTAIDIDEWACENSLENFERNGWNRDRFEIIQGNASSIPDKSYDVILANINRNILLEDMEKYYEQLQPGGLLILSGILVADRDIIIDKAGNIGLQLLSELEEDKWLAVAFRV